LNRVKESVIDKEKESKKQILKGSKLEAIQGYKPMFGKDNLTAEFGTQLKSLKEYAYALQYDSY